MRIELPEVVGIAGHHHCAAASREKCHARIDDVAAAPLPAKGSHRLSFLEIQSLHIEGSRPEQPHEPDLSAAVPPHLGNDACRCMQGSAVRTPGRDPRTADGSLAFRDPAELSAPERGGELVHERMRSALALPRVVEVV